MILDMLKAGLSLAGTVQREIGYTENIHNIFEAGQRNAAEAQREAAIAAYKYRYEAAQIEGSAIASAAARGGAMTGSFLDVAAMQQQNHNFNLETIAYQGQANSRNKLIEARNKAIALSNQVANQRINTMADLMNIGARSYQVFNQDRFNRASSAITINHTSEKLARQNKAIADKTRAAFTIR
jgi:hypothetical protein